ncbi:MAG: WD40 repeat domain-containing protein, partial [Acidimicrobiales bacterium]
DPDNRLVAANLEADWNEALRALTRAQEDYERQAATTAWSPGGERLASGGWDGTVRVWDAASGAEVLALSGHRGGVLSVAWSPGGERLASGGWDGTVRVWDASSGALQAERHLSSIGWAHLDGSGQPVRCSGDAWDWLSWEVRDPATGQLLRLPAETFGPLPGIEPPSHLR